MFDRRLKGAALLAEIDRWWPCEDGDDREGVSRRDAIGAILAARASAGGDPHRYVLECVARGVIFKWQQAADEFLDACAKDAAATGLADAARRKKPKHKNILRDLQQAKSDHCDD